MQSFAEETDVQYKTFLITEKRKPVNVSTPSAASSNPIVSPKPKRRKLPDQSIPKVPKQLCLHKDLHMCINDCDDRKRLRVHWQMQKRR